MRNKKICLLLYFLLFTVFSACGRRGDPVAVSPEAKIPVVQDLTASTTGGKIFLSWSMPENAAARAIKDFIIFRAEVPDGVAVEECECPFRSLDVIAGSSKKTFKYEDKMALPGTTYLYKIVIMDKNKKMGKDSSAVSAMIVKAEAVIPAAPPPAPKGFMAVFARKSVVLTWDDIRNEKIRFYRIYRSEGRGFEVIGTTAASAFTDTTVTVSKKYSYRVTAVGELEGPPSREVSVETEIH